MNQLDGAMVLLDRATRDCSAKMMGEIELARMIKDPAERLRFRMSMLDKLDALQLLNNELISWMKGDLESGINQSG